MLKNKHILLGVTGGIAAYKTPLLVRECTKRGASVRVVMTDAAKEFVAPLTLSTLSGHRVIVGTFPDQASSTIDAGTWHIELGQWAHAMLIAPATANVLAKLAHGYADNAVTTLALAVRCRIILAPAMDVDMWHHQATQDNVAKLKEMGYTVLPPQEGELASGLVGPGRLPEIETLVLSLEEILHKADQDLKGKKILVTAGPTVEAIDPVRFIGNWSSGKMGFAVANAAAQRGADVTLITGRVSLQTPRNVKRLDVESAEQMRHAVIKHAKGVDAIIMAAAVADYTPTRISPTKIKKEGRNGSTFSLELKKTKDILKQIGEQKNGAVVVGFALDTDNGLRNAQRKLREKKLDLIVLNNPLEQGAGFNTDTNIATLIPKRGKIVKLKKLSKFDVAHQILDRVSKMV
ncbi:MAG: bifunctional phosphopantothenoylcysteine decarboxylase/phosphopantothenate--cysteine ligase CoaBC [Ignavibacteriae bacterium]|nr:bifunctional phosphopantothenoylcysteine decarboxylase/phosphopantothenate--cysteine ligase CoaBC [Ignavibacteriota bacterium]